MPDDKRKLSRSAEIDRVRREYAARDSDVQWDDWEHNIYHPRHPMGALFLAHHSAVLVRALNQLAVNLGDKRVLDVGCGRGYFLRLLVELGADPSRLTGVDLSAQRIDAAARTNSVISWLHTDDGTQLPFDDQSFDLVAQSVVFSSVIDADVQRALATEMSRVLTPGGYILWRDHKCSHSEKLVGFSLDAIAELFPTCSLAYVAHADPRIFRRLHQHAWLASAIHALHMSPSDSWFVMLHKS